MKTCFKCGASKPIDDFYTHPMMADGHLGKCKECAKRDVRKHRQKNRAKINAYDRARISAQPERRARLRLKAKEYYASYPERRRANSKARMAIKAGELVRKPCEVCSDPKVVAHHDDYSKPLDVRWLCHSCHRRHHSGTLTA